MKWCKIILTLTLMITLSGCNTPKGDIYQRINKTYIELGSYHAKCSAKVTGNKTENTYDFEVFYESPDNLKMTFLPSNIEILIKGDELSMENKLINHSIHLNAENGDYPNFIINTFFKNYFVGETASAEVSSFPSGNHTVLECELSNKNDYASRQKLIIDNNTLYPISLKTFNAKGDVVIDVKFLEFSFKNKTDNAFN